MDKESWVQNRSTTRPRSESKIAAGQKRIILQAEEASEGSQKRVKLNDVGNAPSSKAQEGTEGSNVANPGDNSGSRALDLNVNASSTSISINAAEESNKVPNAADEVKDRGFDLDLNADDMSSLRNDPFYFNKNYEHLKSRDDSECASSVGSLDKKDSMKVWVGLKQNNYLSTHVAATNAIPKPCGRKKGNNDAAKRLELAKKEQVDRFAKVAAPSGLLNGLNPGIINHVRNRKQVHAIIEALVKSEKTESQESRSKNGGQTETAVVGDMHYSGMNLRSVMVEKRQIGISAPPNYLKSAFTGGYANSYMGGVGVFEKTPSQHTMLSKDDGLALKLSPSVIAASANTSCLSNEESGSLNNVDSLSVKAANVALQWLELLTHDIKGRLIALRRSKKRVRTVITKELPLLLSKEFPSDADNDSHTAEGTNPCHFDKALVKAHAARWNALFGQMETALSEEESNLERWLHQVTEMYSHCERSLKGTLYVASLGTGPAKNNRLREAQSNSEGELAVRAAAASIYSTCNYLLSMENQPPCC